jgi:hypothetical protein
MPRWGRSAVPLQGWGLLRGRLHGQFVTGGYDPLDDTGGACSLGSTLGFGEQRLCLVAVAGAGTMLGDSQQCCGNLRRAAMDPPQS